jgi:NAD+ synthase
MKIVLAQLNPIVGAVSHNKNIIMRSVQTAHEQCADLIVFPECFLSGYPPEDLVEDKSFQLSLQKEIDDIIHQTKDRDIGILLPTPIVDDASLYNAVLFLHKGQIIGRFYKKHLPDYGVFDDSRVFEKAPDFQNPVLFKGIKIGVPICEDIWFEDVVAHYKKKNADILISPNASPYDSQKKQRRGQTVENRIKESGLPIVYLNQVGGQDDLVFDGGSFIMNADQDYITNLPYFEECLAFTGWEKTDHHWQCTTRIDQPLRERSDLLYHALVLGLRDYIKKNSFQSVLIGLSGGIDSALVAAIAVDAIGSENVHTVMMPSIFTSKESIDDAIECAQVLGTNHQTIPIIEGVETVHTMLGDHLDKNNPDITEENIQSRLRGLTLMALSNKHGHLVLATGNKSEYAVGYATLYGDMCGGFAPIMDVYKTTVFDLSQWRNNSKSDFLLGPQTAVIPINIINKPPTAELKPDQKDEDSLPPYNILDPILRHLIEFQQDIDDVTTQGFDRTTVLRAWHLLHSAEHKRRQAAPGIKLTDKAFGRERRYPITNGFTKQIRT